MGSLICLFPDFLEGAEELGMVAQLQPSSYVNMDPAAFLSLAQCSHTTELAACMCPCSGACLTCLSGASATEALVDACSSQTSSSGEPLME